MWYSTVEVVVLVALIWFNYGGGGLNALVLFVVAGALVYCVSSCSVIARWQCGGSVGSCGRIFETRFS
jgi:hypothetical protein